AVLDPGVPVAVGTKGLPLVQPLHVEVEGAFRAVDLPLERVPAAEREPRRLERPDGARLELDGRLDRVVDLPAGDEGAQEAGDRSDLADEVAGEVDDVRGEVAERAGAGRRAVEAPEVGVRVAPVLQVAAPEVPELAELSPLDQLPCEPDCGDEAVVEGAHVLDAGRRDPAPDLVAL